jgi:acyl-CoA thioester hydrolase
VTAARSDIDQLGHVNNMVYMRWVQDIAIAHWMAFAPEEDRTNLLWVVTRHEIDFKRQAFEGDQILVRTWVGRANRRLFERYTEIIRESDEKLLAQCKTVWCPIDPKTGRPTTVSEEVRKRFSVDQEE